MPKQVTLKFSHNENTFEDFYPGPNAIALQVLQPFSQQSDIFCVYLWGPPAVGKTHLLKACLHQAHPSQKTAYISCKNLLNDFNFMKWEDCSLICIDDVENIAQQIFWEETLFHLYNHIQANKGHLIFSSITPPQNLPLALPDLKSRLAASFSIELKPLSDEEKLLILKTRSHMRGFDLSEEVMRFIITHFPRDMRKLMELLNQLDETSLTEKRLVTIPLVKKVMWERSLG
jgi:DnaA family protein